MYSAGFIQIKPNTKLLTGYSATSLLGKHIIFRINKAKCSNFVANDKNANKYVCKSHNRHPCPGQGASEAAEPLQQQGRAPLPARVWQPGTAHHRNANTKPQGTMFHNP